MRRKAATASRNWWLVVVAHRAGAYRTSLVEALERAAGLQVVGCAANGDEAAVLAARMAPDVLLVDARLPGIGGLGLCADVAVIGTRVLIISTSVDRAFVQRARAVGAVAVADKGATWESLRGLVDEVARGGPFRAVLSEL